MTNVPSFAPRRIVPLVAVLLWVGGCGWKYTEVASGFDIIPRARPALGNDGTVVAVEAQRLLLSDGVTSSAVDVGPLGLAFPPEPTKPRKAAQLRSGRGGGDLVFVAGRPAAAGCAGADARGAYHLAASGGGALTTLFEACLVSGVGVVGRNIALSPNGTVAFSQITNGQGALFRGPAAGPVTVLHSGTGMLYNSGSLDINDTGRVVMEMEYGDQGLQRGILAFDTPEQAMNTLFTAIEKLSIGMQPTASINAAGTVAFALASDVTITINNVATTFVAGVYTAAPTLLNTPKSLTLLADLSGPYCGFGSVEISDSGLVAFEARLDAAGHCGLASFDGIFTGPNATAHAVVVRGDAALGGHQFFDDIVLGEVNVGNQLSFTTTYSEPLVHPVKVWRAQM